MAMLELALQHRTFKTSDETTPLGRLATNQSLPLPYLEQLFLKLRRAGLVISSRGIEGGYRLAKDPTGIRLADIIHAVDAPFKATRCNSVESGGCQSRGVKCLTHNLWRAMEDHMDAFLKAITLQDIMDRHIDVKELHHVA